MPLPQVQQPAPETLDEAKARIESEVTVALDEGYEIVEVRVPFEHHETLRAWVESEGLRCGCQVSPGRECILVVNMTLAPPPPKSAEQIQAEIDEAVRRTQEAYQLAERVTQLEALVASLQGGA